MKIRKIINISIELQKLLGRYKNYRNFSRDKTRAYKYTETIGLKVCPYCNINYTYTITNCIRPDIDHFEAQSTAAGIPKALKVDNLIPSCQTCNSRLKRNKVFTKTTHIHPFFDDFDSIKRFGVDLNTTNYLLEQSFKIIFLNQKTASPFDCSRAERNITDFKLVDRYQQHKNEVVEVFKKIKFYNQAKKKEIESLVGQPNALSNLLLAAENCEINQISLGKLQRDIIREYK